LLIPVNQKLQDSAAQKNVTLQIRMQTELSARIFVMKKFSAQERLAALE